MVDGSGTTTYTYDSLYRLTGVEDGAGLDVGYDYDAAGNRSQLSYPNGYTVTYSYDDGNRLSGASDWDGGQYAFSYDGAGRLTGLSLPNSVTSSYSYDGAGRLTGLSHANLTRTLAGFNYSLDNVGNRTVLTEDLVAVTLAPAGAYADLAEDGRLVLEAEAGQVLTSSTHSWLTATAQSGYTGTGYVQALPDIDALTASQSVTGSARLSYLLYVSQPGTYTVWLRGYASNAAGDSAYLSLGEETVPVTGFAPGAWEWQSTTTEGQSATLTMASSGLHTLNLAMREDGLRVDRLLLTTDTNYLPTDLGPDQTETLASATRIERQVDRVIDYGYDDLYRLVNADYSTGQIYTYTYDPVGNRLEQLIVSLSGTGPESTEYLYDAANRLASVDGQAYTFDNNGNLLSSDTLSNSWDAANRLVASSRDGSTLQPLYGCVGESS